MSNKSSDVIELSFRRVLAGAVLALAIGALSACNTTEGAGKDLEAAGEAIQDAAD